LPTFNTGPFDLHAARAAWLAAAWQHGDAKAQRVAQMCCWNNIVADLARLPDDQRLAILTAFFDVYPVNGARIAAALNRLGTISLFVPNRPLTALAEPIAGWAEKVGAELVGIDRVPWAQINNLGRAWQGFHLLMRLSLGAEAAGNTYLLRLNDILVAVMATQRDHQDKIGRMAAQDVKIVAQRALWDLALDEDSGWGDLLEVILMGFWPCGLTEDGTFLVSHRPGAEG
jgi:hypothetical protein